jgi:hypothetical protein
MYLLDVYRNFGETFWSVISYSLTDVFRHCRGQFWIMTSFDVLEYYSATYACCILPLQIRGVILLTNVCNSLTDCMGYNLRRQKFSYFLFFPVECIDWYPTCFLVSTPFSFPLMTLHRSAKCNIKFNIVRTLCTPLKKNSLPSSVYSINLFLKFRCQILWQ